MNFIRTFTRLLHAEKFNERYCNSWAFTAYMDVAETLRATILRGGVGGAVTNLSPLKSTDPAAIAEHLAKTPKLSARNLQKLNYLLGDIYYNARVTVSVVVFVSINIITLYVVGALGLELQSVAT